MAIDEFHAHGKTHCEPPVMPADEYLRMQVAGTVTFPATFPQLGQLRFERVTLPLRGAAKSEVFLVVEETPSLRVMLRRRIAIRYVRAIFQPRDPAHVNYADGEWILGEECLHGKLPKPHNLGIAFLCEDAPSLLEVSAGMTAAESVQYYPPLPCDTSNNHYNPWPECKTEPHIALGECHKVPVGACHKVPLAECFKMALGEEFEMPAGECH